MHRSHWKKGKKVSGRLRMFKGTVIALILLLGGYLVIENILFKSNRIITDVPDSTLSWRVPTEHVDNSPLTDLVGYTVYCWNSEVQLLEKIEIQDPASTSYDLESWLPGTYQCSVTAIDGEGNQSAMSNVVTKTVR